MYTFQTAHKIVFGAGVLKSLGEEAGKLGARALIVCDGRIQELGYADRARGILEAAGIRAEIWADVLPEPPLESVAEQIEACRRAPGCGNTRLISTGCTTAVLNLNLAVHHVHHFLAIRRRILGESSECRWYAIAPHENADIYQS